MTLNDIGEELGVSEATVRRHLRRAGFSRKDYLPEFVSPPLDRPLEVYGKVGIAADWHIPLCDYAYVNKMIEHFVDLGITTLAIPGDFFNMDSLSQYEPKQSTANLEREVYEGGKVMDRLLDIFDRVLFSKGNHDFRIARKLGYHVPFKQAINFVFSEIDIEKRKKLEVSNLDYIWARPFEGAGNYDSWYITHPSNYSSVPMTVGRDLAGKLGSNVLTAHSHHCAVGFAKNGHHVVGELGGLHDKTVTAYLQETNRFSSWAQGYAFIDDDNRLHMESPRWSNH